MSLCDQARRLEDSSSAAWAGQLDTFLNTTEDALLKNVQRCWASLFTPRAIFYRFEKGMHGTKISVAVVVQKMIQSEVSGIAFSVHPVTEDYNQMIIEAGFGLGEAIVSGQVTPDSYVIEKVPRRIIDKNITYQGKALVRGKDGGNEWLELSETEGNKPALSDEQSMHLAEIVLTIESHYGFPCDIEWAFEAGNFYITQSRPITTLSPKTRTSNDRLQYYLSTPLVKMGQWAVAPIDQETWMTEHTARYFEEHFGIPKGPLVLLAHSDTWYSHIYFPKPFFAKLFARIEEILKEDPKGLEKLLMQFYEDKRRIKDVLEKATISDLGTTSTEELISLYEKNRDAVHYIVLYDQFSWLAEDYWTGRMEDILVNACRLAKDSPQYNDALFALIKPREISTTLEEKRAVLECAIAVKEKRTMIPAAAKKLAGEFGWMPVFAFGTPWDASHYDAELNELAAENIADLKKRHEELAKYSELRDAKFEDVAGTYNLDEQKRQLFIDFGLALDSRNEAEYTVS